VVTAWEITPRDANLGRTLDPLSNWTSLDLVERYGPPDTWVLTGPASELAVFTPGMGCILDRDGEQITSGKVRLIQRKAEYVEDEHGRPRLQDNITLGFIADTQRLWSRLCYPNPAHTITSTPSTFSVAHDTRTGTREALILAYTAANLGPAASIVSRRLSSLVLPASLGRGGTTTKKLRMDVLGDVVTELAERGGLRVRIVHDEPTPSTPRLLMVIDDVADVSANVIFGSPDVARATGHVTSWSYSIEDPRTTDAIAFSAGELAARQATRLSDPAAIALWGERVEVLVDQRQTDDVDEITDALEDRLAEGATPTSVEFAVAPGGDTQFRVDYDTGYRVGIELPDLPQEVSDNTIREANTKVEFEQPEKLSLVVGTPGAQSASTKRAARLNKALKRIAMIERSR
jgi:hypothetical protein